MDFLSGNIAANLYRTRKSKNMSLDAVSEQTGVSKSMLAQIEKGTANPSIGILGKIASGLRMQVYELLQTPPMESCLVDSNDLIPTKEEEEKYKVWTCFPYEDNKLLEIYRIDIEPGEQYVSGGHGEKTREYLMVTNGMITIECEGNTTDVKEQQVYRFETNQTHTYSNHTNETVSCMCVFLDYH